MIKNKDIKINY